MPQGLIATIPKHQFSANGSPLVGGTLTTYLAGTTTLVSTYQDMALSIANTNPITLDARGECVLWLDSAIVYKFALKDGVGVIQWTQDNISGAGALTSSLRTDLAASTGAGLIGFRGVTVYAALDSVNAKLVDQSSTDASPLAYTRTIDRTTGIAGDALFATHTATGAGSGYAVHGIDSGSGTGGGGAIGGATERLGMADGIVGNRRGIGDGNGMNGSRWESGAGSGVQGVMRGSGVGHGVYGYKVLSGTGNAVQGTNESTNGNGVYGLRMNGGGDGHGVIGYAAGAGANPLNCASIFGQKLGGDSGPAIFADNRGAGAAIKAFSALNAGYTIDSVSDVSNTSPVSNLLERGNGKSGVAVRSVVSGGGARTALVAAMQCHVVPSAASTGTTAVTALEAQIGANVTGAVDSRAVNVSVASTGGTGAYGVIAVVTGANSVNNAIYGNATGGATNWSGYFVGNVFYGGTLTPSDLRLKTIHGELDTAKALSNVLATKLYCYDKFSAHRDEFGVEHRAQISTNEIGPLAQELQLVTPDHVVEAGEYLAVSDRSELYQLKAAVQELHRLLAALQQA